MCIYILYYIIFLYYTHIHTCLSHRQMEIRNPSTTLGRANISLAASKFFTHLPFCSVKWSFFPKCSAIKSLQEPAARRCWRSFSGSYRRIRVAWVEQKRNVEPQETKGLDPWSPLEGTKFQQT